MFVFKIDATFLYFFVFNHTINIVYTTPLVNRKVMNADYDECMKQIKFAYGNNISASGCFSYAVEHYKKGQYIPGTPEQRLKFETQNYGELKSNYQPVQNYEELTSIYQPMQNYGGTSSIYLPVQNYEELTSVYQPVVQNYGELTSNYQPDHFINSQSFDGQIYNKQEADQNFDYSADQDVDFSDLPIDSFVGLKDFIEKDPFIDVRHFDDQMTNEQKGPTDYVNYLRGTGASVQIEPTFYVDGHQNPVLNSQADPTFYADGYQNPMFNSQAGPLVNHFSQPEVNLDDPGTSVQIEPTFYDDGYQNLMSNSQEDIHRYGPNYAMEYYMELEKLIQGNGIITPVSYCRKQFDRSDDCFKALGKFGTSGISAVTVAFSDLLLSECTDQYVYSYVQFIIENIKIIYPSKKPITFCKEIYKQHPWYIEMKRYKN